MNLTDSGWEELFNRIADGLAGPEDEIQLGELLRSNAAARRAYREFFALHAALHWDYVSTALPASLAPPASHAPPAPSPVATASVRPVLLAAFLAGMVVATAIVLAVLQPFRARLDEQTQTKKPLVAHPPESQDLALESHPAKPLAALLVDEAGAQFSPTRAPEGVRFRPGGYELLAGIIHLRFTNGTDMIVTSPARFEVQDAQNIQLISGKIRVTVPPAAKGFKVATRDAAYIDLGTEFGLRVDDHSGTSDLYVFDGQVNVADLQTGKVLLEVVEEESSRYVDGAIAAAPELAPD
ncbi:MAG: FecR domain-containing protein, partial [Planctomycetota bacterium]